MKESGFPFWPTMVSGTAAAMFGIAALTRLDIGVRMLDATVGIQVLSWVLAVAWVFVGLCGVATATRTSGAVRTGFAIVGAAAVLFGAAFRAWPGISAAALVIMTGIGAVAVGLWLIVVAVQLRH